MKKHLMGAVLMALVSFSAAAQTLVTINGEKIDSSAIDAQVKLAQTQSQGQVQDSPQLRNMLLERMVTQTLINQEAKSLKLQQSDAYKQAIEQGRAAAKSQGADKQATFKQEFAEFEKNMLSQAYMAHVASSNQVTEQEVQSVYQELKQKYANTEEVKLSEIYVTSEADAKTVVGELKKGQKFADVAKARSTEPNAKQTGGENPNYMNLKDLQENSSLVYGAVSSLKKGQYSQPVVSQNVWAVFRVDDRRAAVVPSFDEAKNNIANQLTNQRVSAAIGQLYKKANIQQANSK